MARLIIPSIATFVFFCLALIPSGISLDSISPDKPFTALLTSTKYYLYTYKFWIALFLTMFIVLSNVRETIWGSRKIYQAVIYNQLKDIIEDCFHNKREQVRISVFKKACWTEAAIHYFIHISVSVIKLKAFPKGFFTALKRFPIPFSQYLIIFARLGTPSQSVYSTIFQITDDNEKVEGVIGLAWKRQSSIKITLPDISTFEFKKYKKLEDIPENSPEKANLVKYMKDGNITYDKLRSIHRHSVGFWARKLFDPAREPWGVIVIDSSDKDIFERIERDGLKKLDIHYYRIKTIINRHYKKI